MKHKDRWILLCLIVVSSLVGGSITSWTLSSNAVFAQENPSIMDVLILRDDTIKTRAIVFMDEEGQAHGGIFMDHGKLTVLDPSGKVIGTIPSKMKVIPLSK